MILLALSSQITLAENCLTACVNSQSPNVIPPHPPGSQTSQKKTKNYSTQEAANKSETTSKQQQNEAQRANSNFNEHKDVETGGCSYLTKYVPGAFHKLNTYVCIRGGTKRCELMGKNEKQETIYDWVTISDTSCIHDGDWIDIDKVELDAANSKKNTSVKPN
jgi:hypothetical protein